MFRHQSAGGDNVIKWFVPPLVLFRRCWVFSLTSSQTVDPHHESPEVFNERFSAADFQTVSIGVGRQ